MGLTCGGTFDLTNGYNFLEAETRKRVLREFSEAKPKLVVIRPPCEYFSLLQNLNKRRGNKEWIRRLSEAKTLLRFAMQVAEQQVKLGLFLFEHLVGARSLRERCVEHIRGLPNVSHVNMDQCMFGLHGRVSHMLCLG